MRQGWRQQAMLFLMRCVHHGWWRFWLSRKSWKSWVTSITHENAQPIKTLLRSVQGKLTWHSYLKHHVGSFKHCHIIGCLSRVGMMTFIFPPAYFTCITPVAELRRIATEDLQPETHRQGKCLLLQSITPSSRMKAIMAKIRVARP